MNDFDKDLREAIDAHRGFRHANPWFVLPDAQVCMWYAATEVGEVMSAILAEQLNGHVRRHNGHDVAAECVHVFMMLDSAVMNLLPEYNYTFLAKPLDITIRELVVSYQDEVGSGKVPYRVEDDNSNLVPYVESLCGWRNSFLFAISGLDGRMEIVHEVFAELEGRQ